MNNILGQCQEHRKKIEELYDRLMKIPKENVDEIKQTILPTYEKYFAEFSAFNEFVKENLDDDDDGEDGVFSETMITWQVLININKRLRWRVDDQAKENLSRQLESMGISDFTW